MAVTGRKLLDFVNARGEDEHGVCTCGHWFEEHHDGTCDACLDNAADQDDPHAVADHVFVYSDEFTAESEYLNEKARELGFPFGEGLVCQEEGLSQEGPGRGDKGGSGEVPWGAGSRRLQDLSSGNDAAAVLRKMVEIFGSGETHEAASVVSPGYVDHQESSGAGAGGIETFQLVVTRVRQAFPDLRVFIEDMFAERDRAVARLRWTATDRTGKLFEAESIDIVRVSNGKAAEHWGISRGWPPPA